MPIKDSALIEARNEKIIKRYNYWFNEKMLRFDVVLHKLKWEEFFLDESTITRIIFGFYKKTPPKNLSEVLQRQGDLFKDSDGQGDKV